MIGMFQKVLYGGHCTGCATKGLFLERAFGGHVGR